MEAGEGAHDAIFIVKNGVAAEAALEHGLAHVVHEVVLVEEYQILALADLLHRHGEEHEARHTPGGQGRRDDDGLLRVLPFGLDLGPAEDQTAHAAGDGPVHQLRLLTADQHAVGVGERRVLVILGHGDKQLAGDLGFRHIELVDQRTLDDAQQVKQRQLVHAVEADGGHVVLGDVPGGEHAPQRAVLVDDGHGVEIAVAHGLPGVVDGDSGSEGGRTVVVQVPHLRAHAVDQLRRLHAEAVQQALGLVVDGADAPGVIVGIPQRVAQPGIGDRGNDGVGVRVLVPGDIDRIHRALLVKSRPQQARLPFSSV